MRLEYFENEILFLTAMLMILFLLGPKSSYKSYIFLLSIPIIIAFYTKNLIDTNIEQYNIGKTFICNSNHGDKYIVNQKNGWKLFDLYFQKDSLLLKIKRCDEK